MTREEIEKLAIGVETGYTDRYGVPIKIGDDITLYHKCTEYVGREEITMYSKEYIVGTGAQGYVYTGKIQRQHHKVRFTFEDGLQMTSTGKYKFLHEIDGAGNLMSVVVGKNAPKLSLEELLVEPQESEDKV